MKERLFLLLITSSASLIFSSCYQDMDSVLSYEEQFKIDTTVIEAHLRSANLVAMTDASGVRFIIDKMVIGFPPRAYSTVNFNYTGRLLNGSIFDEGTVSGVVSNFVKGFQIGLLLMTPGSEARIYIPSGLAYGTSGAGSITPNTIIMFELELLAVTQSETEKKRLQTDIQTIDQFLETNFINAIKDQSGLRYVITKSGEGAPPNLYNKVTINYTGKLFTNGTTFYSGISTSTAEFDSRVINYLYGIQVALLKLPLGSKAILYIPSGLGFGSESSGSFAIPANSNLICEIELIEVLQ